MGCLEMWTGGRGNSEKYKSAAAAAANQQPLTSWMALTKSVFDRNGSGEKRKK